MISTKHPTDDWIAGEWVDKTVRQTSSCDGPTDKSVGRISIVTETMFDERGALHCHTQDGHWCPASRLEIVP